jgi:hypothetical protein
MMDEDAPKRQVRLVGRDGRRRYALPREISLSHRVKAPRFSLSTVAGTRREC